MSKRSARPTDKPRAELYPYLLDGLQFFIGHDLWLVRFLQILLGSLFCALLYLVGEKLLSRSAGIAAGAVLAVYAPAIYFARGRLQAMNISRDRREDDRMLSCRSKACRTWLCVRG